MIGMSIHFLMPIHLVNPYEYFYGRELKEFQVYQIFFGGVMLPLASLIIGYIVTKKENVVKPLILSTLVLFFISLMFNGQDVLFLAALSGFIVLLLRHYSMLVSLIAMALLVITHIFIDVLIPALNALNTSNIVYSAIQKFNDYVSIFRTSDLIEYATLNFSAIKDQPLLMLFIFISIPSALIGSIIARTKLKETLNTGMFIVFTVVFLIGGLAMKMIEVLSLGSMSSTLIGEYIGGPMLAIGVFLLFSIISEHLPIELSKNISGLGNLAILSYLIFSILMIIVFYGIGFKLYGEVEIITAMGIALVVAFATGIVTKFLTKY